VADTDTTILLVEDDDPQRKTLSGFLRKRGYTVLEAASAGQAEQEAEKNAVDLLLTDLRLGGPDGITLLETLKGRHPDLQALVLTAFGTVEDAVRAMRAGAYDFLAKPVDLDRLEALVEKALERVRLARENRSLREVVKSSDVFSELVGGSESMRQVKELAVKVAPSNASVLILGESGTGKEVLARAVHRSSERRGKPFMVINCAAMPTLFLDEIGDIPLPVQVKLLNVLQSGQFQRVGGTKTIEVDVRLITATHRHLEKAIQEGTFREDLFYRLNVVSVTMPPLRDRPGDIPLLVDHFIRKHADLSSVGVDSAAPEVLGKLAAWPFPGNVRELENLIERAVVLAEGSELKLDDFPPQIGQGAQPAPAGEQGLEEQVARLEISLIREALQKNGGNKSAAARDLGLSERAIRYKMKKYSLS
jgi:two-component system NtrC family response regulator